jgi:hypothetical protein
VWRSARLRALPASQPQRCRAESSSFYRDHSAPALQNLGLAPLVTRPPSPRLDEILELEAQVIAGLPVRAALY